MTEYHYVISLQASTPRGYSNYGVEGTVQAAKNTTRRELFLDIYERARTDMVPIPERPSSCSSRWSGTTTTDPA